MSPPSPRERGRRSRREEETASRNEGTNPHRNGGTASQARRPRLAAAAVAVLAGVVVFVLAWSLFPHHSSNHDEAVYLQQAAMLADGRLQLFVGDLADAVRPWFFVQDGGRLYPKYAPVPAALFAISMALFGEPRVTLAAVAAGNAALVYVLGSTVADRRVGVVAAALFAASPMALLTSSVFLPYAPTTLLNLLFAVWYLRGVREGSAASAALAGVAVGLAFFARPYTAVLFAAPFVLHAGWQVGRALRSRSARRGSDSAKLAAGPVSWPLHGPVGRHALTAAVGLAFVGLTLAYNARLTGSPWLFPYEAFAPLDGPGFGRRRILGHSVEYTPGLALRANGYVLWYLATRWFTAGVLGTACAAAGLALAARRWLAGARDGIASASPAHGDVAGVLLAGLFVTVPLGNLLFWGNYNVLATMADPTDGLVSLFGPFYHFDLLAPLSVFAALALVTAWRRGRNRLRRADGVSPGAIRAVGLAALAASLLVVGAANAALLSTPVERHAAYTDRYETAYEPFETGDLDDALVFVPTPYGDWLNHPFQSLRNDPGLDGPVVYAMDRDPASDFAVLDATDGRTPYRYTYRGEWTPDPADRVVPRLEPLSVRAGERLDAETTVGVPDRVGHARVRLEGDGGYAMHLVDDPGDRLAVSWAMDGETARLVGVDGDPANGSVALDGAEEVVLTVTLVQPDGSTLTYRQEVTVRAGENGVEAVWPPERSVCPLVTDCGREGTYLADRPGEHREWVVFETEVEETNGTANWGGPTAT